MKNFIEKKQHIRIHFDHKRAIGIGIFAIAFIGIMLIITITSLKNNSYSSLYFNIATYKDYQTEKEEKVYLGYLNHANPTYYTIDDNDLQLVPINFDINLLDNNLKMKIMCQSCNIYTLLNNDLRNEGQTVIITPGTTIFYENTSNEYTISDTISATVMDGKKEINKEIINVTKDQEIKLILDKTTAK